MTTSQIFLPTVEACKAVNLNRFPTQYPSGTTSEINPDGVNFNPDTDMGVQYKQFGDSAQGQSLQNLTVSSNFNPRDIVVQVLTNTPYTIQTKTVNGITTSTYKYSGTTPEPKFEFCISPSNGADSFELDITHNHEWGTSGSIFDKILAGAAELVGNIDNTITKVENISNATQNNGNAFKATPNRRVDVAETYISSEKQSIVIPFTLFTAGGEQNFIRDIYAPIMQLIQVSYPKRSTSLGDLDKAIAKQLGISQQTPNGVTGTDSTGQTTSQQNDQTLMKSLNAINPGFRVFMSDPPAYVNVYHNGGLFSYKNCYITKFSHKYKHWVDGNGNGIDGANLSAVLGNGQSIVDARVSNATIAYPLIAECVLEIKTTEPLFADDFAILASQYATISNRSQQVGGGGN